MRTIANERVTEALARWVALTGYDAEQNRFTLGGKPKFGGLSTWEIKEQTEALFASRVYDPTGLTTFMLLRGLVEHTLQNESFSAFDLLLAPARIEERLVPMRAIRDVLEDPEVVGLVDDFTDELREMGKRYGVPEDKLDEILKDKLELAFLRRDALKSFDELEVHQFTQGAGDPEQPLLGTHVWEFWNVNSLLEAMRAQTVPGINVVLVRDPEEALHSYFIVAFRNGDNLTILTDKAAEAHPLQKHMARRPDRDLLRRAEQHWFPYYLLDVKPSEDQRRLYANARTSIVPANAKGVTLAPIGSIGAQSFVWLVLLADLTREKFWKANAHVSELSYTAQMVREPEALVGRTGALVVSGAYAALDLPKLTRDDLRPETMAPQWENPPVGHNGWLTERYASATPETIFNVVGEDERKLLTERIEPPRPRSGEGPLATYYRRERGEIALHALEPTTFGTREKIQRDRVWTARYNQARVVNKLAHEEYEREWRGVVDAYGRAVRANKEAILDAVARGSLLLPFKGARSNHAETFSRGYIEKEPKEAMTFLIGRDTAHWNVFIEDEGEWSHERIRSDDPFTIGRTGDVRLGTWSKSERRWYCFERPERQANVCAVLRPTCAKALAILTGLAVEELPWALRNWVYEKPYTGNSILDRMDPEDWAIEDPWTGLTLRVGILLSKVAVNERRKKLGLPKADWKNGREIREARAEKERREHEEREAARQERADAVSKISKGESS